MHSNITTTNDTSNMNDQALADMLWHLLHRTLPAAEVDRLLRDAEAVEALYDYMIGAQKASEARISQIKADIDAKHNDALAHGGDAARQEFYRYRAGRTRDLLITKQFMRHLGTEMLKWRRARSEHRSRRWSDAVSRLHALDEPRAPGESHGADVASAFHMSCR